MSEIYNQAKAVAKELVELASLKEGKLVVIGCSTSEIIGEKIGTSGTTDVANELAKAFFEIFCDNGIQIAAQCCEHLNRALVVERKTAEKYNYEIVSVVPHPHAGGSFGTCIYHAMKDPVMVEEIKADAGIDIGNTLIGMHLKRVAIPLRLKNDKIGYASINGAKTRPKLIGGERAKYE